MRLVARFAREQKKYFEIITVYDSKISKERVNKKTPALISIAKEYPSAVWFERKITDDFGIEILYSNDRRTLIHQEHFPKDSYPMRKEYERDFEVQRQATTSTVKKYQGEVIGPIQAYHLDAATFQIFTQNKEIIHFDVMAFYKYRAIEKMLEGLSFEEAKPMVERIYGASSIAYQIAFLDIQMQASKRQLPDIIKQRHMFLLELERVIAHLDDLSVMANFGNFPEGSFFLMKLLESSKELMKIITGHRFGFGAIGTENMPIEVDAVYDCIFHLEEEIKWFSKWLLTKSSLWKQFKGVGMVSKEIVESFGLVGLMARSKNIDLDRRKESKLYTENGFFISTEQEGDSASRFKIRLDEIEISLKMMKELLDNKMFPFFLGTPIDGEYYAYLEGSAGEIMMYIALDEGKISRFYLRDPSFLNAQASMEILKKNKISNLGLILKSIPLSFAANDL